MSDKITIGIIGLGYVGLPLAIEFSKHFNVVGFDVNKTRVDELSRKYDRTLEVSQNSLSLALDRGFVLTAQEKNLDVVNVFIVTVPTPVQTGNKPDIMPLLSASELVGLHLSAGDIVVYESTVYPGCTEEDCVPVLKRTSGLSYNSDFSVGYSPERINPGDKVRTLSNITKIVSGSNQSTLEILVELYGTIVGAGIYPAESIKIAEAAKVIENCQRDINIAFVNELALIFDKLDINTDSVLAAAQTKWNFLPFRPGLVGGHCIGIDPYYLTHKAQMVGYYPEVILAGRRINDSMHVHVASSCIKALVAKDYKMSDSKVLVLGLTFKENCPDIRNSKVFDLISELSSYKLRISVYDPYVNNEKLLDNSGVSILKRQPVLLDYDLIIHAVNHDEFKIPLDRLPDDMMVYKISGMSF
jgi:UDP-N-acetyl-D-glucosamine/UDP-N-acetyl-D-galactosamine dehydrogenase